MRKILFILSPLLFGSVVMVLLATAPGGRDSGAAPAVMPPDAIGCAPGATDIYPDASGKYVTVLPGWGNHSYTISTSHDSAQVYFNQGLSMYYSYHMREALASFREAARFDSSCAMAYWGQALAMGPTYNLGFSYKMNPGVPAVLQAMNRHAGKVTQKEQDMIAAMNRRYEVKDASDSQRKSLNVQYAVAMRPLVDKYPADLDIKALYTDAVMLVHPWDFWYNDGRPKEWTPELVRFCEDILAKDPHHPAALHYYIHVTEASRKPEVALASADSLIKLFPGIAHMVHMSSHEYERIGYYARGVDANEKADRSLVVYDSLAKGLFPQVHVPHYFAVDAYCALSGAMYKKGIAKAMVLRNSVKPTRAGTYLQFQYMFPQLAMVRMGKWQDLLQDQTAIDPGWSYALLLNHFARGMAYAKTGNAAAAETQLALLREKKEEPELKTKAAPHISSPYDCAAVAEQILQATILFGKKQYPTALAAIKRGIRAEDSLIYSEPKVWMLPARQYLGAFLLDLKRPKEAESVYREDLVWNPGNGWSLLGLHQALRAQGKTRELKDLERRYRESFSEAEAIPARSAY